MTAAAPAVWLLAVLAAVLFGHGRPRILDLVRTAGIAAAVFATAVWLTPQTNWIGLMVGFAAGWRLLDPRAARADFVLCGLCVGLAGALHVGSGVGFWIAPALAVGATVVGVLILGVSARGLFVSTALAVVAVAAPIIGLAPDVAAGWRAAQALNLAAGPDAASAAVPLWAASLTVIALLAGIGRALWIRK